MQIDANTIVGDIVKESYKAAPVLENHNIDFCCGGNISLNDACANASVDVAALIPQLEEVMKEEDFDARFIQSLDLDQLADYIEKRHHSYVDRRGFVTLFYNITYNGICIYLHNVSFL